MKPEQPSPYKHLYNKDPKPNSVSPYQSSSSDYKLHLQYKMTLDKGYFPCREDKTNITSVTYFKFDSRSNYVTGQNSPEVIINLYIFYYTDS